ncbi:MAG: precorrin-6y C5,15-methyltransferase (decarboxylating) subunit CbiE [Dehalococcoidales bacterium]|nr:precorrin-6y C5,15-methyltransferase (decarboxylating) subunit CbiE [Dehalococcoidales bacterium]
MPQDKVFVVGVSPEGVSSLSPTIYQLVTQAEIIFGGKRLLQMFPSFTGRKIIIGNNLVEVASLIEMNLGQKRMIVLASGDPGFYGIARYLTGKLGKSNFEIVPNVSSMQLAFARIGESWDDAALTSVHSRNIEAIVGIVRSSRKVGIFTDDKHTPGEIARILLECGIDNRRAYVCQDLGTEEERIIETDLENLKDSPCSPLNVVILIKDTRGIGEETSHLQMFGIADDNFRQPTEGHLITKQEVRAVSLSKLAITEDSIVWDIGAGSGAVSIEAALLARNGSVFATEKNAGSVAMVKENVRHFGCANVRVIQAMAPDKLEELPAPNAIFIGGSGGEIDEILRLCCRRLRPGGRIVVNAATFETLHRSVASLKVNNFDVQVTLVNVARSQDILNLMRLEALNPVFVITGWSSKEK